MFFWLSILILLTIFSLSIDKKYLWLIWGALALLSAFRYAVGTDYYTYVSIFNSFELGDVPKVWQNKELGFRLLNHFLIFLGLGPQSLFVVFSIFTLFLYKKGEIFLRGNERLYLLLFFVFIYFYTLNGIRQAFAASLFLYATTFLFKREYFKYLLLVGFASIFHKSAIILLPFCFILTARLRVYQYVGIFFLSILISWLGVLDWLINILVVNEFPYHYYLTGETVYISSFSPSSYQFLVLVLSFLAFIGCLSRSGLGALNQRVVLNGFFAFLCIKVFSLNIEVFGRVAQYFKPFVVIAFIYFVGGFNWKVQEQRKLVLTGLYTCVVFWAAMSIYLRAVNDPSYSLYAINPCIVGDGCILYFVDGRW